MLILNILSLVMNKKYPCYLHLHQVLETFAPKHQHDSLKGIMRVISSDTPCKDDNVGLTTVSLQAFSGQVL